MNTLFFHRIPWQALILLWLAYALLGWYLSAYHVGWLVGAFVVVIAITLAWKSSPLLERLIKLGSQGLFVTLMLSLIFSLLMALAATWSSLLTLIFIPLVATILAQVEMNFAGFSQRFKFSAIAILAVFGLTIGEIIDILFLPSIRY